MKQITTYSWQSNRLLSQSHLAPLLQRVSRQINWHRTYTAGALQQLKKKKIGKKSPRVSMPSVSSALADTRNMMYKDLKKRHVVSAESSPRRFGLNSTSLMAGNTDNKLDTASLQLNSST